MCGRRAASRLPFHAAIPLAVLLALVLGGCDAADPHVPAVVRAPASLASPSTAPSPSAQSFAQPAATQSGLAPPVMHTVD